MDKLKEDFTDTLGFALRRLRNHNQLLRSIKRLEPLKINKRIYNIGMKEKSMRLDT